MEIHPLVTIPLQPPYIIDKTVVHNNNYSFICSIDSLIHFPDKYYEDMCFDKKSTYAKFMFKSNNWKY